MTSDTQPLELLNGSIRVITPNAENKTKRIVERHGGGFDGLVGYVGAERIGTATVRSFLERTIEDTPGLALDPFCRRLAADLEAAWIAEDLQTCLWGFIAGVETSEVRFWFVVNGELAPSGYYVNVGQTFRVVNDLDMDKVPTAAQKLGVATKAEVLARTTFFFRNGAIVPAANVLDAFEPLVQTLYFGRYPGFPPIDSIDSYAAIVRVRQEFVKRLFEKTKGVWRGEEPGPVGGDIHVYSVDLNGTVTPHHKHASGL